MCSFSPRYLVNLLENREVVSSFPSVTREIFYGHPRDYAVRGHGPAPLTTGSFVTAALNVGLVKVSKALDEALPRDVNASITSEARIMGEGNFTSDRYCTEGMLDHHGSYQLDRFVSTRGGKCGRVRGMAYASPAMPRALRRTMLQCHGFSHLSDLDTYPGLAPDPHWHHRTPPSRAINDYSETVPHPAEPTTGDGEYLRIY